MVRPAGARQVSTFTEVPSSPWPETVRRLTWVPPEVQRASTSQEVAPAGRRPRTWISTQLSAGVRADHEAISSVKAWWRTHGEVQRP